jgi:transcriptional regulator with XRE-family HTH domain
MDFNAMSNTTVLQELGRRAQRERLNRDIAQADLAIKAGISRRALQNFESGRPSTTASLIRILRALDKIDSLDSFLPEPGLSPIQLAKLKGRERHRAGGRHYRKKEKS